LCEKHYRGFMIKFIPLARHFYRQMILNFFITLRFFDVLDIVLVALLLFQIYRLLKDSVAVQIFIGFFGLYLLWLVVKAFDMEMLSLILGQFVGLGAIALLIVFQQEIRHFFLVIGQKYLTKLSFTTFEELLKGKRKQDTSIDNASLNEIIKAINVMSRNQTGALIIISNAMRLSNYVENGVYINGKISHELLDAIFYPKNPLHDGAVIIHRDSILAAKVILPINNEIKLDEQFGTRHRAAMSVHLELGIPVVVVSEETGQIALAIDGELQHPLKPEQIRNLLLPYFQYQ